MPSVEEVEARARALAEERPAVSWRPRSPGGGTDWRGLALVIGALSAMGASVIVPLVLRQPPPDVSGKADKAVTSNLAEEVAAARRDCGAALTEARAAATQAAGANERLDSLTPPKKKVNRSARVRAEPAPSTSPAE